mmetsp:Transcript_66320/g.156624  ORF Transcript_66320/g.156624 Transcript_66320/m.156624 type:complete len:271 (+) Transcript_66320:212-1024(+)
MGLRTDPNSGHTSELIQRVIARHPDVLQISTQPLKARKPQPQTARKKRDHHFKNTESVTEARDERRKGQALLTKNKKSERIKNLRRINDPAAGLTHLLIGVDTELTVDLLAQGIDEYTSPKRRSQALSGNPDLALAQAESSALCMVRSGSGAGASDLLESLPSCVDLSESALSSTPSGRFVSRNRSSRPCTSRAASTTAISPTSSASSNFALDLHTFSHFGDEAALPHISPTSSLGVSVDHFFAEQEARQPCCPSVSAIETTPSLVLSSF